MSHAVVIGVGELGGVFARAFLRTGLTVVPMTRDTLLRDQAQVLRDARVIVLSVGEDAWRDAARQVPVDIHSRVVLVQNELHPSDWRALGWTSPTVATVWFEKKRGRDVTPIMPTEIFGEAAALTAHALAALSIPAHAFASHEHLASALAFKNAYILTTNLLGRVLGGTTGDLVKNHDARWREVAREVIAVESAMLEAELDVDALLRSLHEAFVADPTHGLAGRTADVRAARFFANAKRFGVATPACSGA